MKQLDTEAHISCSANVNDANGIRAVEGWQQCQALLGLSKQHNLGGLHGMRSSCQSICSMNTGKVRADLT